MLQLCDRRDALPASRLDDRSQMVLINRFDSRFWQERPRHGPCPKIRLFCERSLTVEGRPVSQGRHAHIQVPLLVRGRQHWRSMPLRSCTDTHNEPVNLSLLGNRWQSDSVTVTHQTSYGNTFTVAVLLAMQHCYYLIVRRVRLPPISYHLFLLLYLSSLPLFFPFFVPFFLKFLSSSRNDSQVYTLWRACTNTRRELTRAACLLGRDSEKGNDDAEIRRCKRTRDNEGTGAESFESRHYFCNVF